MNSEMSYRQKADQSIRDLLLEFECQPILFVGSGLSRRYFSAPNWRELLRDIFKYLPDGEVRFEYYRQKLRDNPVEIGSALADLIFEWAWGDGREQFPHEFFSSNVNKSCFMKFLACRHLHDMTPELSDLKSKFENEISALSSIKPHAIITTNYDLFLEQVFDGYEPITGQTILKYNTNSFGEIFHIHGDISDPSSIVLTQEDYDDWAEKKKYVSAKLLTYFAEHPVFIFGYGLGDSNVKEIMKDIGELVADETGLIPNVYQVVWHPNEVEKHPPDQAIFSFDGKEYRTRAIHTNDLKWVFSALKSQSALTSINPKLVRALAARTMKLIRHDIPSGSVEVNYDVLERVAERQDELPTLLGISSVNNTNQTHPYTLTQVAKRLGFSHWSAVGKLINRIRDETGIDLRSTDNQYHCKIKTGTKESSSTRKWSHEAVDLLSLIQEGRPYQVNI
ncbi:SIR2 family protein [Kiloniella litopenaei]|uniref:SIR2 family protein n=1 Tax=Kiloniella litopenaei TaxID=1549748 RepID=UPI003BAB4FE5